MSGSDVRDLFSHPEHDRKIRESWEGFLKEGGCAPDALRFLVEDSWRRCLGAKVDPSIAHAGQPLREGDVSELRHDHRGLIEACKPVMTMARDFLSDTGTVMVLTDSRGVVLDVEGDWAAMAPAEKVHLLPGAAWDEAQCGTNAIGTALSLRQPVQIHSQEHFCEGIKRWTCSASVIRDPLLGEVMGVIDVSGLSSSYSRHSLSLVVTAANRIESFLAKKEMQCRFQLIERSIARFASADGSGAILVDRHGLPMKLNENAPSLLAALGYHLDLGRPSKIAGLCGAGSEPVTAKEGLPAWMRAEWVEPIFDNGERVTLVGHGFPLAADFTAPAAVMLAQQDPKKLEIDSLLRPEKHADIARVARLQPHDPNKTVLLIIHGLKDTPATWVPMINHLITDEQIRSNYQLWFYSYPTGYPYLYSAAILRRELDTIERRFPPRKKMVVIGHSMGGCISRLLITDTGDKLWHELFRKSPDEIAMPAESKALLQETLIF
ncbi:MAG: GAF domain-containing protein, partial [Burkholderiaceae bacterium]|nr:GAF domain-containing protein [Burkholderiaceae bacterium]